jgi:SAM-dependent methyltransferase
LNQQPGRSVTSGDGSKAPRAALAEVQDGRDTWFLASLPEFMHGHRKKALFFLACLQEHARAHGRQPNETSVLDLGCGNGLVVSLPLAEAGFDITGVDVHAPSIESARAANPLPNARFECADVIDFQRDERFDAVILSDVLEHVDEPGRLLDNALAHLHADGLVLISIPNGYGPYEIEQFLIRIGLLKPVLAVTRATVEAAVRLKRRLRHEPWPPPVSPDRPAYNAECGHAQFFTLGRLRSLLHDRELELARFQNGAWFGGDLTYFAFYFMPTLVPLSLWVADRLPARVVSTWYIACRRQVASN